MNYLLDYFKDKKPRIEASLQRFFEKLKSNEMLQSFETVGTIDPETFRKSIYEPCKNAVIDTGGKRLRPVLTYLSHDLVGGNFEYIDDIAIIPELAHKGSVVIDDIQDKAQQRDGREPIYKSYGIAAASNAGGFLYFAPRLVLKGIEIDEQRRLEILENTFDAGVFGHIGQGSDIYWGENWIKLDKLPNDKEYLQMCAHKISPFKFAANIGAIAGNASKDQKKVLVEIIESMATAYQIKDDLLSLDSNAHDYGDDIRQGKVTLMLLKTLEQENENHVVRNILSLDPDKIHDDLVSEVVKVMKENGSIDYAENKAKELVKKAQQILINKFPDSYHRKVLLEFINYGMSREK